jgi:hypothetical protein
LKKKTPSVFIEIPATEMHCVVAGEVVDWQNMRRLSELLVLSRKGKTVVDEITIANLEKARNKK